MDNFAEMTVEEYLFTEVDPYLIEDMSYRNSYWQSCADFVENNVKRKLSTMSEKQRGWLLRIKRDLESELHGRQEIE